RAAGPEGARHLDHFVVQRFGPLPNVHGDQGLEDNEDGEDGGKLRDAEPHQGNYRPREAWNGEPYDDLRFEETLPRAVDPHENPEADADQEGTKKACGDSQHRRSHVDDELARNNDLPHPFEDGDRPWKERGREEPRDRVPDYEHGRKRGEVDQGRPALPDR